MGTTTFFKGSFKTDRPLDASTIALINKLSTSRRMQRHVNPFKYGVNGELYVLNHNYSNDEHEVIDSNAHPETQAGLWCQWRVNKEGTEIAWDGNEKFYDSAEWILYIQQRILKPRGYTISGIVNAKTEYDEKYHIIVTENKVKVEEGFHPDVPKPRKVW